MGLEGRISTSDMASERSRRIKLLQGAAAKKRLVAEQSRWRKPFAAAARITSPVEEI